MTATRLASTNILGVPINALALCQTITTIEEWVDQDVHQYVCVCDLRSVVEADRNLQLKKAFASAGLCCPDGMPLVWLSRWGGQKEVSRVCGPDLMEALCRRSRITGHRHFFYGGGPGIAERVAIHLGGSDRTLNIAGVLTPGSLSTGAIESDDIIAAINSAAADILWVGLGCPKQELWMHNHRAQLNAKVLVGVGAAFDFHSGSIRRAPKWVQRAGFEWLFRIYQQPRYLAKRYVATSIRAAALLIQKGVGTRSPKP